MASWENAGSWIYVMFDGGLRCMVSYLFTFGYWLFDISANVIRFKSLACSCRYASFTWEFFLLFFALTAHFGFSFVLIFCFDDTIPLWLLGSKNNRRYQVPCSQVLVCRRLSCIRHPLILSNNLSFDGLRNLHWRNHKELQIIFTVADKRSTEYTMNFIYLVGADVFAWIFRFVVYRKTLSTTLLVLKLLIVWLEGT